MSAKSTSVRVRYAPSPTGPWHIGGVRTALFNWLFARKEGGSFIVRIEDTDVSRSKKEYEDEIFEGFKWLGLAVDERPDPSVNSGQGKGEYGPYRQSERLSIYKKYLERLLREEKAYYCYCTKEDLEAERQAMMGEGLPPKYGGHCRSVTAPPAGGLPQAIRFRIPEGTVEFKDMVRGTVSFDASLFGDIVIARNLDAALYNFAVVVDDELMKISHVIRGEDHLANTPKQILFQQALGFKQPVYAHIPLILNPDRSKMSKRHAETSLLAYREQGFLREAVLNFLALLGWHPSNDQEIFSLDELVKTFDIKRVQKSGAAFDAEKLLWLNREYLKRLSPDEIGERLQPMIRARGLDVPQKLLRDIIVVQRDRMRTLSDFFTLSQFFFELPEYDPPLLVWREDSPSRTQDMLRKILAWLEGFDGQKFTKEELSSSLAPLLEEGRGSILWPLRVAVSGLQASPDPVDIMTAIGREEAIRRVKIALDKIGIAVLKNQ